MRLGTIGRRETGTQTDNHLKEGFLRAESECAIVDLDNKDLAGRRAETAAIREA